MEENEPGKVNLSALLLCSSLLGVVLVVYSQTFAWARDEGFHLLAAQLIKSGKRPYLDFMLAQTPLNAYWNAAWMWMLGERWHAIHAIDALLTTAAVALAADFARSRSTAHELTASPIPAGPVCVARGVPGDAWRTPGLAAVLVLAGANSLTVEYGTTGQAYALGLVLIVGAFRLSVASVSRERTLWAGLAGFLSGAAAGSTLLTAPVAPVLLVWILSFSAAGKKVSRGAAFVVGVAMATTPLLVLFVQSPARVIFDVFRYHMFYRLSDWPGATRHDLELFVSPLASPQALMLGALSVAGLWFVARSSGWDRGRRGEFYLCGWLALALGIFVSTAHPTFSQYYVFTVPFLAILSSLGLLATAAQLGARRTQWLAVALAILASLSHPTFFQYYVFTIPFLALLASLGLLAIAAQGGARRALWPLLGVGLLTSLMLVKEEVYDRRFNPSWPKLEAVARKVDEVTPPGAALYADEPVYFLTRRAPPPGNEYLDSHKLRLPAALSALVHVVPQLEFDRRIQAGVYNTVETCEKEDWMKERKLGEIYRQEARIAECAVFWDPVLDSTTATRMNAARQP